MFEIGVDGRDGFEGAAGEVRIFQPAQSLPQNSARPTFLLAPPLPAGVRTHAGQHDLPKSVSAGVHDWPSIEVTANRSMTDRPTG